VLTAATAGPVRQGANVLVFLTVLTGFFFLAGLFARWLVVGVVDRKVVARSSVECWTPAPEESMVEEELQIANCKSQIAN
jgi:hypothetical protein